MLFIEFTMKWLKFKPISIVSSTILFNNSNNKFVQYTTITTLASVMFILHVLYF